MSVDISVVIATRDRLAQLQHTWGALQRQSLDDIEAELVVVDNGSTDGTARWIEEQAERGPLAVRPLMHPAQGASAARNRGVEAARGRIVLFLNDDTSPADSGLLRAHVAAHADRDDLAVLGRASYPSSLLADPFMAWLANGPQFDYRALEAGTPPGPQHFYSAHLSLPRERFLAVGGMDERIPYLYEDSELGVRLTADGIRLVYRPDLRVVHDHSMTLARWALRMERVGTAGALVNRLHPADPPIAMTPRGPRWRVVALLGALVGRIPTDWRWTPRVLRGRVYGLIHAGAYVRGYRSGQHRAQAHS